MSGNMGSLLLPSTNKRPAEMAPSPKAPEFSESVRSKLRESLAGALALVCRPQNKLLSVEKGVHDESLSTPSEVLMESQMAKSTGTVLDADLSYMQEKPLETLASNNYESNQCSNDGQSFSYENFINENKFDFTNTWKFDVQEYQPNHISSNNEVTFINNSIIKDELLQGNGLCWVSDLDIEGAKEREHGDPKRLKLMDQEIIGGDQEQALLSPQTLANKIETGLFKLFGGVNKKYKEKGRSLLFNLKDHNNPELRERVMSGKISPERLCCMTVEELASKELSEWRIAKAEERAQMIILPDSEIDIRRLVRKTHKGEFQVEFELDDSISVEVAVGTRSHTQISPISSEIEAQIPFESHETESQNPSKCNETDASKGAVAPEKVRSMNQRHSSKVTTLPLDGTDFMQDIAVDELNDAEFLPPILLLDEFMESLDYTPSSENKPEDTRQDTPVTVDKSSGSLVSKLDSPNVGLADHVNVVADEPDDIIDVKSEPDIIDVKSTRTDINLELSGIRVESETDATVGEIKGEHIWEGLIQLNISAMATVIGFHRSGEKTTTEGWPSFLEIKGRVRLDAFEKFVQELPMSRSRAIMVVQFCWKDGSHEGGHLQLLEVADSYVADERVGFAEPVPGVELYFCPPHKKMIEMLGKYLPKEHSEPLNAVENGLIGIVVWRKAFVSTPDSTKMPSFHRQYSQKQHSTTNPKAKQTLHPLSVGPPPINPDPPTVDDPTDDIPPGFGPQAAGRDEEDLPEFDFAPSSKQLAPQFPVPNSSQGSGMRLGHPQVQPPPQPMGQVRDLINKYGQGKMGATASANQVRWQPSPGIGLVTQPWNDDDDIPEWQPQQNAQPKTPPPLPSHNFWPHAPPSSHPVNQQFVTPPSQWPRPLLPFEALAAQLPVHSQPRPSQMVPLQGQHAMLAPLQFGQSCPTPFGSNGPSGMGFQGNGLLQPCQFGGQPFDGQFQKTSGFGIGQNGMDWRPDSPRNRGA
ncbi:hypothetical protein AAC387_Pa03g3569 [Persea americana]